MSTKNTKYCDLCEEGGPDFGDYLKEIETPAGEVIEVCKHHTRYDCREIIHFVDSEATADVHGKDPYDTGLYDNPYI